MSKEFKLKVLLTGGAGYIGSHTCINLLEAGVDVTVVDNLSNSCYEALASVEAITNRKIDFFELDIRDYFSLSNLFAQNNFDAVIHFAGLKAVGESVADPLTYYDNNVVGTLNLLRAMHEAKVKRLVFSSSATVYGNPQYLPISETAETSATNPYGRTKLMIEEILADLYKSDTTWKIACLRYFNPVGAHSSGLIGENPSGIPNNLMPYIAQVANGIRSHLKIFGGDYDTLDGTGVRDYIHVMDLAAGHLSALNYLNTINSGKIITVNLGTGIGYSVLDILHAFEAASGKSIPYKIVNRRAGDVAACYANPSFALNLLGWKAKLGIDDMCKDAWRWQVNNSKSFSFNSIKINNKND